jgi:hypothetical protein
VIYLNNTINQTKFKGISKTFLLLAQLIVLFLIGPAKLVSVAILSIFAFAILSSNKKICMTFENLEIYKKNKLQKSLPYSSVISISLNQVGLLKRAIILVNTESNNGVVLDLNDFTKKDICLIINTLLEKNPQITLEDATRVFITTMN